MENKKISYLALISDLYVLLFFSYIIYAYFYGFERIGNASFNLMTMPNKVAFYIGIGEIVLSLIFAELTHKCNKRKIRITTMLLSLLNIIYRIINVVSIISIFNMFMIILSLLLFTTLRFYKQKNTNN